MDEKVAKGLCIVFLFIDTIIFGWPPYFLVRGQAMSERALRIKATVISYLNCFAGGVFMGACLLHMMAEGREEMEHYFERVGYHTEYPFFETLAAVGFFLIAAVEIIAHKLLHKKHAQKEQDDKSGHEGDGKSNGVSSIQQDNGKTGHVNPSYPQGEDSPEQVRASADQGTSNVPEFSDTTHYQIQRKGSTGSHDSRQMEHAAEMAMAMHSMDSDPLRAFLLLAALSFHTVFDGLAIGLEETASDVWQMFIAICIHKSLVALCLGTQLFLVYKEKPLRAFLWIFLFSLIPPIGVGIGMYLTEGHGDDLARDLTSWILQGLATGTFLYVTFFEILRDELMENGGVLKLLAVMVGFGGMAAAKALDEH